MTKRHPIILSRPLSATTIFITFCILFLVKSHTWTILYNPIVGPIAISTATTTNSDHRSTQSNTILPTTSTLQPKSFPRKLWYKLGPKGLSDDARKWTETCITKNPSYRVEFLTDESAETYVKEHFTQHRPDIVELYLSLPIPILKADLLRYLILYTDGGIWSDLDVTCSEVPISNWLPAKKEEAAHLVVGLEFDWAWQNDDFLHSQFASWTIMSKPGGKHMMVVIDDLLERVRGKAKENNVTVSELKYEQIGHVVDLTGPKGMTRSLVKSLELMLGTTIDDRDISGLLEPKMLDDILILPGNQFAAAQSGYPENQPPVLVTHQYAGSWKNDHGGENA